jgi:hypothetical protein
MASPKSVQDIDLTPLPGKTYFNIAREWREEFIYFLMVDRFHDGTARAPVLQTGRSRGIQVPDAFYGGKIKGITQNLDYIAGLGWSAIWLSTIFGNNAGAYHGYNINNYLEVDPNFGTKQDLIDLVDAAHNHTRNGQPSPIRIILDVVINHSGDNWEYKGGPKTITTIPNSTWTISGPSTTPSPPSYAIPTTTTAVGISPATASIPIRKTSTAISPASRTMPMTMINPAPS